MFFVVTSILSFVKLKISLPRLVFSFANETSLRLPLHEKTSSGGGFFCSVDPSGFEPLTSEVQARRSTK